MQPLCLGVLGVLGGTAKASHPSPPSRGLGDHLAPWGAGGGREGKGEGGDCAPRVPQSWSWCDAGSWDWAL